MKNKKIEFEKLKNRLKNIFFKRLLKVVNATNSINLIKNDVYNESEEKSFDKVNVNSKEKPLIVIKNIKNETFIPKNIEKINNLNNYSSFSINPNIKKPIKLENNKIISKKSKFIENSIKKIDLNKINLQSKKLNPSKFNNNNTKSQNNKNSLNKSFELFKHYNIKLITKPNEIKSLKIENVYNQDFEVDEKLITIPSKEQLKNLQNNIKLNKADLKKSDSIKLKSNKIKNNQTNIKKIENNFSYGNKNNISYENKNNLIAKNTVINKNYLFNYSKFNPTAIEKNKVIYALPAYQEGTGGPTSSESIGKIHKGELILNKKESKTFSEALIKNISNTNLTISKTSEPSDQKTEEYKIDPIDPYNPDKPLIPISEANKAEIGSKISAQQSNEIFKPDLLIKEKIDGPLFVNSSIKKQSPPLWRTTVG